MGTLFEKSERVFYFWRMKKRFLQNIFRLILGSCLFISCAYSENEEEKKSVVNNSNERTFRFFVKKFKVLPLPLQLRTHQGISLEDLQKVDEKEAEAFFKSDDNYYCFGMLEDTTHYYSLLLLYPADRVVPRIFTFSKDGELISSEDLIIHGCSGECGFRKCTSDCLIDEKKNISLIDTTDFYECDENGEEIQSSRKHRVEIKKYYLGRLGKITHGKQETIDLLAK